MDEKLAEKPGSSDPPRYSTSEVPASTLIKPQARIPYDSNVTFEEYNYYAQKTREEEETLEAPVMDIRRLLRKKHEGEQDVVPTTHLTEEDFTNPERRILITDEEWLNASRSARSAGWGACFYLITTDILGPYGSGFAMGTLGWGPGIAFYTVFGLMVGYSGYLIWRVFCGVDSHQFPAKNYGDLGFRTWGRGGRYVTNVLQGLSLLLLVGQVTLQFGQNISQMSKFKLCYAVCPAIFAIAGFFITQIRTLRAYGWVANLCVWLNIFVIFMTMGVLANSEPNYSVAGLGSSGASVDPASITKVNGTYPPVMHYTNIPPDGLVGSINGMLNGVLAYAGAQLFVEFMAEMKRPRDFIKAMWLAQAFIYSLYLTYGCVIYHFQGQYSYAPAYQGISVYSWQTVGNMITLIAALIAGGLYGNIGIKVVYNNILLDILKAPPLTTRRGKIIYGLLVPVWWIIAFIIAAAIPDYFGFVSVMSASLLLNLSYTLPPLFALGFDVQKNAVQVEQGEGFDPITGQVNRNATGVKRWIRGFFAGGLFQVSINIWHVIYFLASLSMCGLGMYGAVSG
ncbi:uncharacterized protein PFLUO_LOCUS2353 [Penicillium psychrofluorescens]|uniref:uncharacterized protein n=1 Tax=Penicillium psychrofluorescens TaxID=3158075 RepID=UPI003CCDC74A